MNDNDPKPMTAAKAMAILAQLWGMLILTIVVVKLLFFM